MTLVVNLSYTRRLMRGLGLAPFWEDQLMSSEVPIEIEDKPTAVSPMRELVEHLQDAIEALKREIAAIPRVTNTARLSRAPANASPSPSKSWHRLKQGAKIGGDSLARQVRGAPGVDEIGGSRCSRLHFVIGWTRRCPGVP
jgi:hypothetical protein